MEIRSQRLRHRKSKVQSVSLEIKQNSIQQIKQMQKVLIAKWNNIKKIQWVREKVKQQKANKQAQCFNQIPYLLSKYDICSNYEKNSILMPNYWKDEIYEIAVSSMQIINKYNFGVQIKRGFFSQHEEMIVYWLFDKLITITQETQVTYEIESKIYAPHIRKLNEVYILDNQPKLLNIATNKITLLPYMPYLNHELIIGCLAGNFLLVIIKQKSRSNIIIQLFDFSLNSWQIIKNDEEICNSCQQGGLGVVYLEQLDGVLLFGNLKNTYLFKLQTMSFEVFGPSMPWDSHSLLCNYMPIFMQGKVYIQSRGVNKEVKNESLIYWQNKINVFDTEKKLWKVFAY